MSELSNTPQVPAPQVSVPSFQPPQAKQERRVEGGDKAKGPFVKYVGQASHRRIAPYQWGANCAKEHMADSSRTYEWSIKNNKMIPSSEFSDHQLDYLLCDDLQRTGAHSFLEVDYDEDGNLVQTKTLQAEK